MSNSVVFNLRRIECIDGSRILFAADCGSRAQGVAVSSSDYDIAAVSAKPVDWYWRYDRRDLATRHKLVPNIDVTTFDVTKFVGLLLNSNLKALDMLYSPEVYEATSGFRLECGRLAELAFNPRAVCMALTSHLSEMMHQQIYTSAKLVPTKLYIRMALIAARINHLVAHPTIHPSQRADYYYDIIDSAARHEWQSALDARRAGMAEIERNSVLDGHITAGHANGLVNACRARIRGELAEVSAAQLARRWSHAY